jgi:hypothetical protein
MNQGHNFFGLKHILQFDIKLFDAIAKEAYPVLHFNYGSPADKPLRVLCLSLKLLSSNTTAVSAFETLSFQLSIEE